MHWLARLQEIFGNTSNWVWKFKITLLETTQFHLQNNQFISTVVAFWIYTFLEKFSWDFLSTYLIINWGSNKATLLLLLIKHLFLLEELAITTFEIEKRLTFRTSFKYLKIDFVVFPYVFYKLCYFKDLLVTGIRISTLVNNFYTVNMPRIHNIRSTIQYNATNFEFYLMNLYIKNLNAVNDSNKIINDVRY